MAVPQTAYNTLMGMFRPQQAPAGASVMEQAQADARNQMLGRLGFGLLAAAIPQTAAQRTQALQQAFGGMGDMGTSVYNNAQARLMAQQIDDRQKAAQEDAAFREKLRSVGAPAVGGAAPISASVQPPVLPSLADDFRAPSPAAQRIVAPPPPSASVPAVAPISGQQPIAAQPQTRFNELGLTPEQTTALLRLPDSEQRKQYNEYIIQNAEDAAKGPTPQPSKTPRYGSSGVLLGYDVINDKGVYSFEPIPQDPKAAADIAAENARLGQASQLYYGPQGYYTQATNAASSLGTTQEARAAVEAGIFSGPTGFIRENAARLQSVFGIEDEALANTALFKASVKQKAMEIMAMIGGNDTDREYREALDIVGSADLTDAQIRRLIELQEKLAIKKYNTAREYGATQLKLPDDARLKPIEELYPNLFDKEGKYIGFSKKKPETQTQSQTGPKPDIYRMSVDELTRANIDLSKLTNEEMTYIFNKLSGSTPQVPTGN